MIFGDSASRCPEKQPVCVFWTAAMMEARQTDKILLSPLAPMSSQPQTRMSSCAGRLDGGGLEVRASSAELDSQVGRRGDGKHLPRRLRGNCSCGWAARGSNRRTLSPICHHCHQSSALHWVGPGLLENRCPIRSLIAVMDLPVMQVGGKTVPHSGRPLVCRACFPSNKPS